MYLKKTPAIFFLIIFCYHIAAQETDINAVYAMPDDTVKIKALLALGAKNTFSQPDSAKVFFTAAIKSAEKYGAPEWMFVTYLKTGNYFHNMADYEAAEKWKRKSLYLVRKFNLKGKFHADVYH